MEFKKRITLENMSISKESAIALIEELALSDIELNLPDNTVAALLWGLDTLKQSTFVWCRECRLKDTNACPSYDTPMSRTSLRAKFCSAGDANAK